MGLSNSTPLREVLKDMDPLQKLSELLQCMREDVNYSVFSFIRDLKEHAAAKGLIYGEQEVDYSAVITSLEKNASHACRQDDVYLQILPEIMEECAKFCEQDITGDLGNESMATAQAAATAQIELTIKRLRRYVGEKLGEQIKVFKVSEANKSDLQKILGPDPSAPFEDMIKKRMEALESGLPLFSKNMDGVAESFDTASSMSAPSKSRVYSTLTVLRPANSTMSKRSITSTSEPGLVVDIYRYCSEEPVKKFEWSMDSTERKDEGPSSFESDA